MTQAQQLTRDEMRTKLLGRHQIDAKLITVFGVSVELRAPTLDEIVGNEKDVEKDSKQRATEMIIKYSYVPGTNERVFEDTDHAAILQWPFCKDLLDLQRAINVMAGLDSGKSTEELQKSPLEG